MRSMRRMKTIYSLALAWIALFGPLSSFAQIPPPLPGAIQMAVGNMTLSQAVTVSVQEINELSIVGDVHLIITTATPGSGPDAVTDAATATYSLTTNATGKKIIGSLDSNYASGVSLSLLLGAPSSGTTTSQILSTTAMDLVTGINYSAESGLSISYTANADVSALPNGSGETRTVTLTLMDN